MGSRLLPLVLATAALGADAVGLGGLALWLGLAAVPAAAAVAFVAVGDAMEGRPVLLRAVTSGLALALVVLGSAVRENAPAAATAPSLSTYALVGALLAYAVPAVAWVLEPVRVPARRQQRLRRRPAEADAFSEAA
jgi:hypothetical protein